eukprot:2028370-Pyramimonas_sp.AAC.1
MGPTCLAAASEARNAAKRRPPDSRSGLPPRPPQTQRRTTDPCRLGRKDRHHARWRRRAKLVSTIRLRHPKSAHPLPSPPQWRSR